MQLVAEIEEAVANLSSVIRRVEVTEGFREVLDNSQLDEVEYAAIILSIAVTEYLVKAILFLEGNHLGNLILSINLTFASVISLLGSKEYVDSKEKVERAIKSYSESMGYLTATMTAELLHHDKDERREKIINWIWEGDSWQRHKMLREKRVPNTATWFLESAAFKDWRLGTGSHLLLCIGIRKQILLTLLILLAGAGKSFITFSSYVF